MKQKLEAANEEERSKNQQVSMMEKTRTELLEELLEANGELERAYSAMGALEKVQKTQV